MQSTGTTLYPRCLGSGLRNINNPLTVVGLIKEVDTNKGGFVLEFDPETHQTLWVVVPGNQDIDCFTRIQYIEVRGMLSSPGEISLKSYTDFKSNFDLLTYNEMLKLSTKQFRDLFNY